MFLFQSLEEKKINKLPTIHPKDQKFNLKNTTHTMLQNKIEYMCNQEPQLRANKNTKKTMRLRKQSS